MKILAVIVLISIAQVKGRTVPVSPYQIQEEDEVAVPQQNDETLQDDPNVTAGDFVGSEDGMGDAGQSQDLMRFPRQPSSAYDGHTHPMMIENPSARTIGMGGMGVGLQKSLSMSFGTSPQPQANQASCPTCHAAAMPMAMPMAMPVPVPMPMPMPQPPPVQYQTVPYVAGYSLTPVYAQKHVPVMPMQAPCPHEQMPMAMPMPMQMPMPPPAMPAPPSLPGLYFNKHISAGIGRSAENDDHLANGYHYVSEPFPHQLRSSDYVGNDPTQYAHLMVDPMSMVRAAQSHSLEPNPVAPVPVPIEHYLKFKRNTAADAPADAVSQS